MRWFEMPEYVRKSNLSENGESKKERAGSYQKLCHGRHGIVPNGDVPLPYTWLMSKSGHKPPQT